MIRRTASAATMLVIAAAITPDAIAQETPQACCIPDDDSCQYLLPNECFLRGGAALGPGTDCSFGLCCPAACCLPDETCELLTFHECMVIQGGVWYSSALSCSQINCQPPQACCIDDAGCVEIPPSTCFFDMGGTPQGTGSTCDPDPCPPLPPRACCEADGGCWNMTTNADMLTCIAQDGLPMGDSCAMTFCFPTEACCMELDGDPACVNMMSFACSLGGGGPQGDGSTCSTTTACGFGACCLDDGSCELLPLIGCTQRGGSFIAGENFCGGTTCAPRACCYGHDPCTGAFCDKVPLGFCVESGGAPLGPDTACADWPCGTDTCCLPDGSCVQLPAVTCLERGGLGQAVGTDCATTVCQPFQAGACCLGATECVITRHPSSCTDLGGTFLGFDTGCPTQTVEYQTEPGGDVCNHAIVTVVDCPTPGLLRMAPCVPGAGPKMDTWTSPEDAQMCHTFGITGSPSIPAGFFGPGSDPFAGPVCLRGVPLGTVTLPEFGVVDVGLADTIIRRESDPFDRCALPSASPVTVPIELAALSLQGVAPVIVGYDGGSRFERWSVTVDLSAVYTDGDPSNDPPVGELTATKSHCDGGTYTSILHVQPRFTFALESNPSEVRVLDLGSAGVAPILLDASAIPAPWVSDVDASLGAVSPICTSFHPGLAERDLRPTCDCNTNSIRDRCDIESGSSLDCNANEVPDSCDLADGTSDDCNTTTIPDECDIAGGVSLDCNTTRVPDECEAVAVLDFDGNGVVDLVDHRAFVGLMAGVGVPPPVPSPECLSMALYVLDVNGDQDIDLQDFAAMQRGVTFAD